MKPIEGSKILVYGQEAVISQIVQVNNKTRIYLEHSVVVPGAEYTRDYISIEEIQKYIENENNFFGH
ncbi:MAG: hypothetical protein WC466_09280 [Candidatus Izemoplasmatales bacterium]